MDNEFIEIDKYWSDQRILESYIRGESIELGSDEYWQTLEVRRHQFLYYLPEALEYFKSGNGSKLLEIGCGMGVDLAYFIKNGFDSIGIDLAQGHLRLAKDYMEYKGIEATLLQQNAENLEFEDEYFDCVYSIGVLHHTPNTQKGIDEMNRVLRKGGRCVVMLYNKYSFNNLVHLILRIPYDNLNAENLEGKMRVMCIDSAKKKCLTCLTTLKMSLSRQNMFMKQDGDQFIATHRNSYISC